MKRLILLPVIACFCLQTPCLAEQAGKSARYDQVAEEFPFPRPAFKAQDVLPGAPQLSQGAQKNLNLRRAFFARDFARLDAAINADHERLVQGQPLGDEADAFETGLESTELAGIDACRDWLAAMPRSYAAHWMCGAMWRHGAWIARSGEYAHQVTPIRFALMRERLQRSNDLLEKAIGLSPKPVEALTALANNRFLLGDAPAARALLQKAEALVPTYGRLHGTRVVYSMPVWGGSVAQLTETIARAKKAGVDEDRLRYFQDHYVAQPWTTSTPGGEKIYWERAIAERPTASRLKSLAEYFQRLENWRDSLPVATRWIEKAPDDGSAYWTRAVANERLGKTPEALSDYRMAAALGDNLATQTLILAHIQGRLGLTAKSWYELDQVCRYGAALGSSAASNCLGSMFWEGNSIGGPFRTDLPQSLAWHLFAARGGYHNSQYDLGWILLTGRGPGVTPEQAKRYGLFWLRRAAELNHQFAKKKLQEGGYGESEAIDEERAPAKRTTVQVREGLRYPL